MLKTIIIPLFLNHIPQVFSIVVLSSLFLLDIIDLKKTIIIGITGGILVFVLRSIPFTFGFHTIIFFILLILAYHYFYEQKLIDSFFAIIKSFLVLSILEIINVFVCTYILKLDINSFLQNPILTAIATAPQTILIYLISFIYYQKRGEKTCLIK